MPAYDDDRLGDERAIVQKLLSRELATIGAVGWPVQAERLPDRAKVGVTMGSSGT